MMVIRAMLWLGVTTLVTEARKNKVVSVKLGSLSGRKGKTIRVLLDSSEPQIISKSTRNIANASVSPWTYRESFVPSRIPQLISEAECLTSACIGPQGGAEDAGLKAAPIKYQILVLHRVPKKNQRGKGNRKRLKYDLRLGAKVITVGCTCVRPTVVSQN
ncbi:interleukin 17a/f3 [Neosynchiropus ocellatus]